MIIALSIIGAIVVIIVLAHIFDSDNDGLDEFE